MFTMANVMVFIMFHNKVLIISKLYLLILAYISKQQKNQKQQYRNLVGNAERRMNQKSGSKNGEENGFVICLPIYAIYIYIYIYTYTIKIHLLKNN